MQLPANKDIDLAIVVPFKDEQDCLPLLLRSLRTNIEEINVEYEIILVDDGSSDESWNVFKNEEFSDLPLRGFRFSRNFGKEAAIRAGLTHSRAKATIVIDADLQHPPEIIPEMYSIWKNEEVSIVEAVRSTNGEPRNFFAGIGAYFFSRALSLLAGFPLMNATDFKLLDRKVVDHILNLPEKITFFRGIIAWLGLPSKKVYFNVKERAAGSTQWSLIGLICLALDGITGFTTILLRVVTFFSFFFIALSLLLILQTFYNYFAGNAIEGFTTVIICILLVGGVIAGGLGIIGEYLGRIYEEVKGRPTFIIKDYF